MRAVLQRVSRARVEVAGDPVGSIAGGFVALVGVGHDDDAARAHRLAAAIAHLRVFPDDAGKMNRSVLDVGGEVLVVSQFTLFADTSRGRRPSFTDAADPAVADGLLEVLVGALRAEGITVATGRFGAHMEVELINDGPVTIILEV